jgi:hypothetical protein
MFKKVKEQEGKEAGMYQYRFKDGYQLNRKGAGAEVVI